MKDLLTYIAENLVDDVDAIEVTETSNDAGTTLSLKVASGDVGRVIGRGGRTAKEIRTLVRTANKGNGKVMVDFVD